MTDKFQSYITVFMRVDTIIAETNMLRKLTKRRAVSPVIATVILVAVTITVAVAVSYWMSGITGQYTSFEKVEIQTAICTYNTTLGPHWQIIVTLKNSGTKAATLTHIFVNEIEVNCTSVFAQGNGISGVVNATNTLPILSGASSEITVWIDDLDTDSVTLTAGTTVNIKIHSASGMDYIKLVQLT